MGSQELDTTEWLSLHFHFQYFFLNYFNWRLIPLQYCGGFCQTLTWINDECTCIPPSWTPSHLPPHPLPQGCPRALALSALSHALNLGWWSVSYAVIHVSVLFSQIIPPSPSPTESNSLFFISVSLFAVPHIGSLLPSFLTPYIRVNKLYWCFSFWLTSLCIIGNSLELTQRCSF